MPVKVITHPVTGQQFRLGRNRPPVRRSLVSMRGLQDAGVLPQVTVPDSTSYAAPAAPSLSRIFGNDTLGDCVVAGGAHIRGVTSFNAGAGVVFTDDQIIQQYSAIGGYDPSQTDADGNNPTDQGCDENTAIAYWKSTGFPDGVKISHAVAVDANRIDEVRLAMYLFENLLFGIDLPDDYVNPMPSDSGFVWDLAGAPNPMQGHCVIACDLVPDGVLIDTWGMTGTLTQSAISYYACPAQGGQLFALLTPDIICRVTDKSPAGYSVSDLEQYLASVGKAV